MKIKKIAGVFAAIAGTGLMLPAGVMAATATTSFQVTATVADSCSVAATTLAFGSYDPLAGSPDDATSTITVTCTSGTGYTVALDDGANGTFTARQMSNGTDPLDYNIYTSSGYTTVWGDGTGATATVAGTGNGAGQGITVYGRVPAAQFVSQGSYTDTINVTVTY